MPRVRLTEEQRLQRKRENDKLYYERHKADILMRQRLRYSPEQRRDNYVENAEEINEKRRQHYIDIKKRQCKERIEDLRTVVVEEVAPVVDFLLTSKVYEKLFFNELTVLENILLLSSEHFKAQKESPQDTDC